MIRLDPRVRVEIVYQAMMGIVDCRLLFLGDHFRQLVRLYEEIAYRYSRAKDLNKLYKSLMSSAEIVQFYQIHQHDGKVSVTLRDSVFQEPGPMDEVEVHVKIWSHRNFLEQPLPLDRMRALGTLLPLLNGGYSEADIHEKLKERLSAEETDWAEGLLGLIKEREFIRNDSPGTNYFLRSDLYPRLAFLGHSTLFLQSQQSSILVDPFLRVTRGLPETVMDVLGIKIGAICCSHSHWDHCHLETLLRFDKDTPIFIPKVIRPTAFNPPIAPALRQLGFTDIREAQLWEPLTIGDIELIPVPFHGEQEEPDVEMDHFTYLLRTQGLTLYGGVDCFRDTFGDMKPVLQRVRDEYHPTIAFLPISKMVYYYKDGGPNSYCRYLDNTLVNKVFQYTASAQDAAEWVNILDVQRVSPYAIFSYSRWSTPPVVTEFYRALNALGLGNRLLAIRPLDSIDASDWNGGMSANIRRGSLLLWFRVGGVIAKLNRRLMRHAFYRLMRKVFLRYIVRPA